MQEVWLFGDSYCQDSPAIFESTKYSINREFISWPNRLKQNFNLKNFSRGGTGPTWSLYNLNQKINENLDNLDKINLIFFVSAIWRLDLKFYSDPSDQCLTTKIPAPDQLMINSGWDIFKLNKEERNSINPYKCHRKFVKNLWQYYLLTESFQNTELLKIIGNLKLHSELFKKVLVWPIFHKSSVPIRSTDSFFYVDNLLFEIEKDPYGFDPRYNHLSEENHTVMFNQLYNWVENSTPVDVKEFIKK